MKQKSSRISWRDLADASFEERERGPEAEARHQAYIQNAYATLAPARELIWYGARAGLQVGVALLATETAVLLAILAAAFSVERDTVATLYGATPLAGTFFEPLWPVLLSLPAVPVCAAIGVVAALARRAGNRWRRALDHYFSPVMPLLDLATFWLLGSAALMWAIYALGLAGDQRDPSGLLTLAFCAGGVIAWPCHWLWLLCYLPLIRARGSASMEAIQACIQRQL